MQLYRLMGILVLLMQRQKLTTPQLAQRFEVSPRTIRRDIEVLCQAGVPVVTTQGYGGGITIAPGYRLDLSCLTQRELLAIFAGARGVGSLLGDTDTASLLARMGRREPIPPETPDIDLGGFNPDGLSRLVGLLSDAIREKRLVQFLYYAPGGVTRRTVEPCRLLFRYSFWYLSAWCTLRQDFRTFKLARMTGVELLAKTFTPRELPPDKAPFGEYFARENYSLLARFSPEAEYRLVEEYGAECFSREEDGGLLFQRGFADYGNLCQWVLSFGDQVQVLAPQELREDLLRQAEGMAAFYRRKEPDTPLSPL